MKNEDFILETKNLHVSYGAKSVLHDINLKIRKNKITAIIGPSGCGKSTFLQSFNRMLFEVAKAKVMGEIFYQGEDILTYKLEELRQRIGMVFQNPTPFPFSVYENIVYVLRYYGAKDKKQLLRQVESLLRAVELYDEVKNDLQQSAMRLSGGQQQRLCIARALAVQPEVILLDEPCSALDVKNTAKIENLLQRLSKKYTIVIVTHNLFQAKRLSDDLVFLLNGEIVETGLTENIFVEPQETLTKEYFSGVFG